MSGDGKASQAQLPTLMSSAILIVSAADLTVARSRLGPIVQMGIVAFATRDPENRSRIQFRLLPTLPMATQDELDRVIALYERSAVVTAEVSRKLRSVVALIQRMIPPRRGSVSMHLGNLDIDGAMAPGGAVGDIFCILGIAAQNENLGKALSGLPGSSRLGGIAVLIALKGLERRSYNDDWILGGIENGNSDMVMNRLDEAVHRRRLGADRAKEIAVWLELLAARSKSLPVIRLHGLH